MSRKNVKVKELELLLGNTQAATAEQIEEANRLEALLRGTGELTDAMTPEAVLEAKQLADLDDLDDERVEVLPSNEELSLQKLRAQIADRQKQLGEFKLSVLAKQLLAAAVENVAQQRSATWMDADQREETKARGALLTLCNFDLEQANALLMTTDAESGPGQVYSLCFAVQKGLNFVANGKYRAALRTDEDRRAEAVERGLEPGQSFDDAHRDAPVGCGQDDEDEVLELGNEREHRDSQLRKDQELMVAYEDLHLWLQLVTEANGWDAEAPMPYLFVASRGADGEPNGNFQRVDDAEHALDIMEVRSAESRARRTKRRVAGLGAALEAAKKLLMKAAA